MSLHQRATSPAKAENMSLNQLLLSYVSEGIARNESTLKSR